MKKSTLAVAPVLLAITTLLGCFTGLNPNAIDAGTTLRANVGGDIYVYAVTGTATQPSTGRTANVTGTTVTTWYTDTTSWAQPSLKAVSTLNATATDGSSVNQTGSTWYSPDGYLWGDPSGPYVTSITGTKLTNYYTGASAIVTYGFSDGSSQTETRTVTGSQSWSNDTLAFTNVWRQTRAVMTTSGSSTQNMLVVPSIGTSCQYTVTASSSGVNYNLTVSLTSYTLGN